MSICVAYNAGGLASVALLIAETWAQWCPNRMLELFLFKTKKSMKQIVKEKELIGKQIEKAVFAGENKLFLVFKDSFCIIQGEEYGEPDVDIRRNDYNTTPNAYNCRELLEAGLISQETANKLVKEYHKENDELVKKNELKQLSELKAKYPEFS